MNLFLSINSDVYHQVQSSSCDEIIRKSIQWIEYFVRLIAFAQMNLQQILMEVKFFGRIELTLLQIDGILFLIDNFGKFCYVMNARASIAFISIMINKFC